MAAKKSMLNSIADVFSPVNLSPRIYRGGILLHMKVVLSENHEPKRYYL
jgi:hypothetical protein